MEYIEGWNDTVTTINEWNRGDITVEKYVLDEIRRLKELKRNLYQQGKCEALLTYKNGLPMELIQ